MTVYLDHAATTPMLPEVLTAYTEALGLIGNPSSIHSDGQNSKRMLEEAREQVAAALGADPIEVVFTSGGTESINLAVKGLFWSQNHPSAGRVAPAEGGPVSRPKPRILVPLGEHHATLDTVEWLERHEGAIIEWLPIDELGRIRVDAAERVLAEHDDVALLTFLWANNEVGTIQPVAELVALADAKGVPVHVDAVSAFGHVPVDFAAYGIFALAVSAHKIGGPLGIGALVLSRTATVEPLIHGGGQQRQVRSGTQDAPAAIGFGVAAQRPLLDLSGLRDRLIEGVREAVPSAVLRGHPTDRLSSNVHFTFPGCEGDSLLFLLDAAGVAVSTGSACQA
ncbi:MAG TPA: cysteine desulfurase family protein, partial [Terrimesophilobacter sp.]|nr:cysteine desulfurase family protein [Terrimesophilobacter sp.]